MESLAKDFKLDQTHIYSEKKFNRLLIKKLKKEDYKEIKHLKEMIKEIKNKKRGLKKKIFLNPWLFLKALYLYTISEV